MTQYKIKTTHGNGLPGIDHASGDAGYSSQLGSPMRSVKAVWEGAKGFWRGSARSLRSGWHDAKYAYKEQKDKEGKRRQIVTKNK